MINMNEKILCIDDEPDILDLISRYLKNSEFTVDLLSTADEAISAIKENNYAIIISDVRLADTNGIDFICNLEGVDPATCLINMSSHTDIDMILKAIQSNKIYDFINKPLNKDTFLSIISKAITHYRLIKESETLKENLKEKNIELEKLNNHLDREVQRKTYELNIRDRLLSHLSGCNHDIHPFEIIGNFSHHLCDLGSVAIYTLNGNKLTLSEAFGSNKENFNETVDSILKDSIEIHSKDKIQQYQQMFNFNEDLHSIIIHPLEKFNKTIGFFILVTPSGIEQKFNKSLKKIIPLISLLVYDNMVEKNNDSLSELFSDETLTE
jgi:FixJ family two-component response regulator